MCVCVCVRACVLFGVYNYEKEMGYLPECEHCRVQHGQGSIGQLFPRILGISLGKLHELNFCGIGAASSSSSTDYSLPFA